MVILCDTALSSGKSEQSFFKKKESGELNKPMSLQ